MSSELTTSELPVLCVLKRAYGECCPVGHILWKRGEMVDREILNIILCLNVSEEGQAREWQGYAEVPFQDVPSDVILPPPPPILIHEISKPTQFPDREESLAVCVSLLGRETAKRMPCVAVGLFLPTPTTTLAFSIGFKPAAPSASTNEGHVDSS